MMLALLFIINNKTSASPLNPNSIYTTSKLHNLINDAYYTIPKTLGPYFLYIPDEIKTARILSVILQLLRLDAHRQAL